MVKKKIFLPKLCIYFKTISCNEFVQGQRVGINNMKDRWPKYLTVIEIFLYVYKQIGKGWLKKRFFYQNYAYTLKQFLAMNLYRDKGLV